MRLEQHCRAVQVTVPKSAPLSLGGPWGTKAVRCPLFNDQRQIKTGASDVMAMCDAKHRPNPRSLERHTRFLRGGILLRNDRIYRKYAQVPPHGAGERRLSSTPA